jgi:hypothetical protein
VKPNSADWCPNAPSELIDLYQEKGANADLLLRLLQDRRMTEAWAQIDRRVKERGLERFGTFKNLWGVIRTVLRETNRAEQRDSKGNLPHVAKKKQCLMVAEAATSIANTIAGGPLDKCAHEFFPSDVVRLARLRGADLRGLEAAQADLEWTSIVDLLRTLATRARSEADVPPVVERVTREYRSNHFIRRMADHFESALGGTMEASLVAIANVVLDRNDSNALTIRDVKRALNHRGK